MDGMSTTPDAVVAQGGFCAPSAPLYDFYRLTPLLVPDTPEALIEFWQQEISRVAPFDPKYLPSRRHPFKRQRARMERKLADERVLMLARAVDDLKTCLDGGERPPRVSDLLPVVQAPRGGIRFIKPPTGDPS